MENQTVPNTPTDNAAVAQPSVADMSLADYRKSRETPAAVKADDQPVPANDPAAESAAAADEQPGGEGDGTEPEAGETPEQKAKKKGGFQRKIERAEAKIAELEAKLAGAPPAAATPVAATSAEPVYDKPKPKLEDCESIEDYTEKLTDWKADERDWRNARKAEEAKQRSASEQLVQSWQQKTEAFKAQHADYDDVLAEVADVKLSPAHQKLFLESDQGVALAYALAQKPADLKKFAAMNVVQAAKYIGALEASLPAAAPNEQTPKVSGAPRPIRPVSGGNAPAGRPDISKLSLADYRAQRESGRLR